MRFIQPGRTFYVWLSIHPSQICNSYHSIHVYDRPPAQYVALTVQPTGLATPIMQVIVIELLTYDYIWSPSQNLIIISIWFGLPAGAILVPNGGWTCTSGHSNHVRNCCRRPAHGYWMIVQGLAAPLILGSHYQTGRAGWALTTWLGVRARWPIPIGPWWLT